MEGQPYVRSASGKVGQVNATEVPRYAGIATFARLPQRFEVLDHDIAVVGVPFDSGVTYRPVPASARRPSARRRVCSSRTTPRST